MAQVDLVPEDDVDDSILQGEAGSLGDGDAGGDSIRVFVRMRPPNQREGSERCQDAVIVDPATSTVQLLVDPPRVFAFDGVLSAASTQEEVFKLVGTSVGEACLNGYNGSVYVYGQTGSGKTYTMQGPVASVQAMRFDERRGIMCRMLDLIFSQVSKRHNEGFNVEYRCRCSYLEIYKEQITDLLEPSANNLQVREDINRGVYVERLSEHTVWTLSDALHALWKGLHQRHVGATQMNELSSRSHAVFTLVLEATSTAAGGVTSTRSARLNLIDLAGSERQPSSDQAAPGSRTVGSVRVKEAGAINKSLSALTNVIMSLSHAGQCRKSVGGQRRPFVRYRDSKLTFLLRDSLGGNSKTVIAACISPAALCFGETLSTLKFAARAKHIQCSAVLNEEYSGTVESLMLEVKSLKRQLELLSSRGLIPGVSRSASQASWADLSRTTATLSRPTLGTMKEEEDDDPISQAEGLTESAAEDLRRIYGQRRVRRLEILLATALERERRCELKRHKLDKFAQYLNGLLERKESYFDALRDYFTLLVDQATTSGCLPPEVTRKLLLFRQQLCSVPTDGRAVSSEAHWDSALGGRASASVGDLAERSPRRGLPAAEMPTPRSRSFGILASEAMSRGLRRGGYIHPAQGHLRGAQPVDNNDSSTTNLVLSSPTGDPSFTAKGLVPGEEDLAVLRIENRLLRRQLENHPELHRLAVENRLLRQHLASLVQERALAGDEPRRAEAFSSECHTPRKRSDGWKGRGSKDQRHSRELHEHEGRPRNEEGNAQREQLPRPRSLTRTSRSSILGFATEGAGGAVGPSASEPSQGARLSALEGSPSKPMLMTRPFPGCEDATQISPSSSSAGSGLDQSDQEAPSWPSKGGTLRSRVGMRQTGTADAASFLPTMAREVEELLREKTVLEDTISQLMQPPSGQAPSGGSAPPSRASSSPVKSPIRGRDGSATTPVVEVEQRVATEIFRGANEALLFAEGILAKGKGDTLLLSAGPRHENDSNTESPRDSSAARATAEGLDERDVFLSLMRSLPAETTLSRQGAASSAPHLSNLGGGHALAARTPAERHTASATAVLRPSSSMGSASTRLLRNRSTVQLHRIVESPFSPRTPSSPGQAGLDGQTNGASGGSAVGSNSQKGLDASAMPSTPGDLLREATGKMKQLCSHLEFVSNAYRDVREQFKPLEEEYLRKCDECRFLEAQCRRLDMQSSLLEEQAAAMEARRPKLGTGILQESGKLGLVGTPLRHLIAGSTPASQSPSVSSLGVLHSPEAVQFSVQRGWRQASRTESMESD